jgi:hypothetical protein
MLQNTVTEKTEEETLIYHPTFLVGCNCEREASRSELARANLAWNELSVDSLELQ